MKLLSYITALKLPHFHSHILLWVRDICNKIHQINSNDIWDINSAKIKYIGEMRKLSTRQEENYINIRDMKFRGLWGLDDSEVLIDFIYIYCETTLCLKNIST